MCFGLNPGIETLVIGTLKQKGVAKWQKKRVGRYPDEFKRMCVERMKQCNDIGALAKELDIHRRMLYRWRDQLDPTKRSEGVAAAVTRSQAQQ